MTTESLPIRKERRPYLLIWLLILATLYWALIAVSATHSLYTAGLTDLALRTGHSIFAIALQRLQDQGHIAWVRDSLLFWAAAAGYLLPTLIADLRRHADIIKIALLNALLGWTGVFWVVSLIWSATPNRGLARVAEEAGDRAQKKMDLARAKAGRINADPRVRAAVGAVDKATRGRLRNYEPPPEGTPTLLREVEAVRDLEGMIRLVGTTLLPYGMPIDIRVAGAVETAGRAVVESGGNFVSEPLTHYGRPLPPGAYQVRFKAGPFKRGNYDDWLLEAVGPTGTRLPLSATVPDDPEFPQHGRHLNEQHQLSFEPLAPETALIEQVKQARLEVKDRGMSSKTVEAVIRAHFQATPDAEPVSPAWAAREIEAGIWSVTFSYKRNRKLGVAEWQVELAAGTVRYADPIAKALSYG